MEIIEKYFSEFTPKQHDQYTMLKALYVEWNEKINVISRKDMDNFYERHVLHSLAIAARFEFKPGTRVIDLGCGGGFPGIPLAIFFPGTEFLLADSINKKLNVVKEVASAIGLTNVQTRHTRAEEIKDMKFDTVMSRAVAPLADLWRWSKLILKNNGTSPNGLISLKGGDLTKEIVECNCRPVVWEIEKIFEEDFFKSKYILFVKKD